MQKPHRWPLPREPVSLWQGRRFLATQLVWALPWIGSERSSVATQPFSLKNLFVSRGDKMKLGMIGLGRMGANMVRRLINRGHCCVVFARTPKTVNELVEHNAVGAASVADLAQKLERPRTVWLMVPAAVVDQTIADLLPHLEADDILVDGGNSYYVDDIRRARELAQRSIHYVDVGTS